MFHDEKETEYHKIQTINIRKWKRRSNYFWFQAKEIYQQKGSIKNAKSLWKIDLSSHRSLIDFVIHAEVFLDEAVHQVYGCLLS